MSKPLPMTRRTAISGVAAPFLLGACLNLPPLNLQEGTQAMAFELPGRALPLRCVLTLPSAYLRAPAARWPLLVFLHGSGERGTDLEAVKMHGPPKLAALGAEWPVVLVSPQLEAGGTWSPDDLHALVTLLKARLRIDPQRVLATGLSLGGHGVWNWAASYPNDLAAIAPVCGYGDASRACRALKVPVRAYHGDADAVVPLAAQQACVDALRACGGTVDFIIFPGVGHNAWDPAYNDPDLLPWLLRQRRA